MIIETPSANIGIRGTDSEMEVEKSGMSTITLLSGEVEFYNNHALLNVRKPAR